MADRTGWTGDRARREVGGLVAVVVLARLVLGLLADGPHLFPDEIGYLGAARHFAGAGPDVALGPVPLYYPLYSVVLAPIAALGLGPSATFSVVMVVNALLGGATAVVLYLVSRRTLGAPHRLALVATALATLHPGHLLLTETAWADNLIPLVVLAWVLALWRWVSVPSPARAGWVVLAATVTYWSHPRGIVLLAATVVAAAAATAGRRAPGRQAIAVGAATVAAFAASRWLVARLLDPLYSPSGVALQDDEAPSRLLDPGEWAEVGQRLLGAGWYQVVGTAGLAVVGVVALARRHRSGDQVAGAVLLVLGGLLLGSALFHEGERADTYFYGRYVDSVMPLVLVAAVLEIHGADRARRQRLLLGAGAAIAGLTATFTLAAPDLDRMPLVGDMVLGVVSLIGVFDGPEVLPIGLVALGVAGVVWGLARRAPSTAWAVLLVVFLGASVIARTDALAGPLDAGATLEPFASDLASLADGAPIGMDLEYAAGNPGLLAYQWFEPDIDVYGFDSGTTPRSPWLVGPLRWSTAIDEGARLVAVDPSRDAAVYVLPGEEQDRLVDAGAILPDGFPAVLARAAMRARIAAPDEARVEIGSTTTVPIEIQHDGAEQRWPRFLPGGGELSRARVRIGARVVSPAGEVVATTFADLPHDLLPGERASIDLEVAGIDDRGDPLPPGRYLAVVDAEQVDIGWFSDLTGTPTMDIDLLVLPPG